MDSFSYWSYSGQSLSTLEAPISEAWPSVLKRTVKQVILKNKARGFIFYSISEKGIPQPRLQGPGMKHRLD